MPTHSDRRGSIKEIRPGVWRCRYDLAPDPLTGERRPRSKTIRGTKADARRELNKVLREIDLGLAADPGSVTLAQYLDHWLSTRVASHCNALTQANYRQHVERHIVPCIGGVKLRDLTAAHITAMHARLLREGNKRTGLGLAHSTLHTLHIVLSTALNHAVEVEERLARNPCRKAPPPPVPKAAPKEPDSDFRRRLLEAVSGTELYLPVVLGLTTGLRKGEILGLWWSDISFVRGTLKVQRQLQWIGGGPTYTPPKSEAGIRTLRLSRLALAALREERARQEATAAEMGDDYEDSPHVVRRPWGELMTPATLSGKWRLLVRANPDLRGWRMHHTRHGCATVMLEGGVDPKVAADYLGHAGVGQFHDTYSHVTSRLRDRAAEALDAGLEADFREGG